MSCKCDTINIVNDNNIIVVSHADGRDGKSAYQQAVEGGYTGTEQEFNCSLSLLADVAEGKRQIADAINYKGGNSTPDESFQQLAEDIKDIPYTGISSDGIVLEKPFSFLDYCCNKDFNDFTEIDDDTITNIKKNAFNKNKNITKIRMGEVTTIGTGAFLDSNLQIADFPKVRFINNSSFQNAVLLHTTNMPSLEVINTSAFQQCTNIIVHKYPNAVDLGQACFLNNDRCINIEVGVVTNFGNVFANNNNGVRNFTIGQGTDVDIQLQNWIATNAIKEGTSGIDELNSNLYNNLLTKLYDHSEDGQTRILRLGWLAHVTQENIDYANSKGWTLTT